MLNFCDFIQVYVFTTNHHLNGEQNHGTGSHGAFECKQMAIVTKIQ